MAIGEKLEVRAAAIYARVSSEDQVSGTSLDDQVDKCLKQAAVYGWEIPQERIFIDDGYSGSNLERPQISRLRQAIAAGEVDCVMVFKLDRLSRNIRDTVNLVLEEWSKTHKVVFRSVTEDFNTNSPLGTLIFSILASFAHFERDVIRDRTENGRRRRFGQGRRAVAAPPFGYTYGEVAGTMVIVPAQAEVVKRIYHLYLKGLGFHKIAMQLNAAGYRTTGGALWTDHSIRYVATNEVYTGKVKYSGEYGAGHHDAIIDQETFDAVQEVRKDREWIGGRTVGSPWLLAGLCRCKKCDHMMFTQPGTESKRKRKDGTEYVTYNHAYYLCGGRYKKGNSFCTCGHIRQDVLEEHVVQRIKMRFGAQVTEEQSVQTLQDEIAGQVKELEATLLRLEQAVQEKEQAIERWENAFERGELNADRFGARVTRLEQEMVEMEAQREQVAEELEGMKKKQVNVDWMRKVSSQLDSWALLTPVVKKQLANYLIDHIRVWKVSQGKGKHKEETEIEVDIVWNRAERALPEGDLEGEPALEATGY